MSETIAPESEADIAAVVADASASKIPLEIAGGGTRLALGRPSNASRTLSLNGHCGVSLYEPGALTLVAKAGTPLKEIEAVLAAEGQRLPFEPMDHRTLLKSEGEPTIGGTVACNNSGSRRIQSGACRDSLIGVRFVNGQGECIKNGGRVMKNVTGYDLVKLMCGSYGTLGVLTEVSFKVLPTNAREATIIIPDLSVDDAVGVMSRALGSPFEITGAAFQKNASGERMTGLRVEGFPQQVDYKLEQLNDLLRLDSTVLEGVAHDAFWQRARNVEGFAGHDLPVWKISVKPSAAPVFVNQLQDRADAEFNLDWGGGQIWAMVPEADNASYETIRSLTDAVGGHATLVRAPASLRSAVDVFHPQPERLAQLSAALRRKFDPSGVLNPGRMAA